MPVSVAILLVEASRIALFITNTKFTDVINSRFIVDENKLVKYREVELPKVVSVYAQIDCTQFKVATEDFVKDAKIQEELNRQAREEAARKEAAQAAALREQAEQEAAIKSDKEYKNAIENVERYESEHDYENMREWAGIALTHRPDDEYAKEKQNLAQQLLAEQRAMNKQFSTILQRIKVAYSEGRWSNAISQCDIALELRSDSEEVKRIKRDSKRHLDIKEKVTNFLNRADMFLAQKLYNEALEEVGKVLSLDSTNEEAKLIKRRISDLRAKQVSRVKELVNKLKETEESNDFNEAIQICDALKEEDASNITKWISKKDQILYLQKEIEEKNCKLNEQKSTIQAARLKGNWKDVLKYTQEVLETHFDSEIAKWQSEAQEAIKRIKVEQIQNDFLEAAADEDWEKAIALYDDNSFLKLKSSNATWYRKAKLCFKAKSSKSKASEPRIMDIKNSRKEVDECLGTKPAVREKRIRKNSKVGPSRPTLANRPRVNPQNSEIMEIPESHTPILKLSNSVNKQDKSSNISDKMEFHQKHSVKKIKIINKPKR